jgi:transposase
MIDISDSIFIYSTFVDMRKSINGLSILISLDGLVFDIGKAFVFFNKKRDKIKILVKENNGFMLLYKSLDEGIFKITFNSKNPFCITRKQLRWLLDGLDYKSLNPLRNPTPKHYF